MSTILFSLSQIQRHFLLGATKVNALRGIDLTVAHGESIAIWGPSGSGKSTLLNVLGLIDTPDSGTFSFEGQNVLALSDDMLTDFRNQKIGFIFQSFNLIPVLTALENIILPLHIRGVADREARARAKEWLVRIGLERFADFRPDTLSGGQRQRVAIARALVIDPKVVIADEPTANLDSENSIAIINLLQKLNRETGVTCIFSTHDPRLLEHVQRHLRLVDGLIMSDTIPGVLQ